ncbi:MAG: glycosyltransferase [Candidatus Margulisiibacteriota bacterium]
MNKPLVSIITATLNQGEFIQETIDSLKRQSYKNFEHIVIDGVSNDGTLDILKKNAGSYNMRWWSERDPGMYAAINKGLRLAQGDILCYLNSDDLYLPWTLETVAEAFARFPAAGFIYGDMIKLTRSGKLLTFFIPPIEQDHFLSGGFLAQAAVFFRRSVYERHGGFDETLKYVADCDYWMKMVGREEFQKIEEFLAVERDHAQAKRFHERTAVFQELAQVRTRYTALGANARQQEYENSSRRNYGRRFLELYAQRGATRRRRDSWYRTIGQLSGRAGRLRWAARRARNFAKRTYQQLPLFFTRPIVKERPRPGTFVIQQVAIIAPESPLPLTSGSKIRIYHSLQAFAAKYPVSLAAFAAGTDRRELESLRKRCQLLLNIMPREKTDDLVRRSLFSLLPYKAFKLLTPDTRYEIVDLLDHLDQCLVWAHDLASAAFLPAQRDKGCYTVLDLHNLEQDYWGSFLRHPSWSYKFYAWQNLIKTRWLERLAFRRVDAVAVVSEQDRQKIAPRLPRHCRVLVVPNGVDTAYYQPVQEEAAGNNIILCGSLDITMNADAAVYFAKTVLPLVRQAVPDAALTLVGRDPGPEIRALAQIKGITVTGTVDDVRPYYREARIAVVPHQLGAGTKLKVLEALALGVPVVASVLGAHGLEVKNGENIVIAADAPEMARQIVDLLANRARRQALAAAGRRLVEECYNWPAIFARALAQIAMMQKEAGDKHA